MKVMHCNECSGIEDVSHVVVTVERRVAVEERPGLAKDDSLKVEGDLCAACLKAVIEAVSEEAGLGLGPLSRHHADYSEVT
jgi:hypothetical protein